MSQTCTASPELIQHTAEAPAAGGALAWLGPWPYALLPAGALVPCFWQTGIRPRYRVLRFLIALAYGVSPAARKQGDLTVRLLQPQEIFEVAQWK